MKPEFFKPFDLEHARAGAPCITRGGLAATILKWDASHPEFKLVGVYGPTDRPTNWKVDGSDRMGSLESENDLVMAPLGLVDGKPVFVEDELVGGVTGLTFTVEPHHKEFGGMSWPAPAPVYPETRMNYSDLSDAFQPRIDGLWDTEAAKNIANAALRHAIDAGQVTTMENAEHALKLLGNNLCGLAVLRDTDRDMAIAKAVRTAALTAFVPARGYELSEDAREITARTCQLDLAAIIATIK